MGSNRLGLVSAVLTTLSLAPPLLAVPIATLYSTGVDDNGVLLAGGAVDPHWRLTLSPDPAYPGPDAFALHSTAAPFANGYVPNTLTSRWIGPRADGGHNFPRSDCTTGCLTADYHFETTFDLFGLDPTSVEINGQWAVDDSAIMLLNGVNTGISRPYVPQVNWKTWAPFTLNTGFVPGVNTMTIIVNNHYFPNSSLSDNATGLQVNLSGTANVPEPQTVLLLLLGAGVAARFRKRVRT